MDNVYRREQKDPDEEADNEKDVGGGVGKRGVSDANKKSKQERECLRNISNDRFLGQFIEYWPLYGFSICGPNFTPCTSNDTPHIA